jgi:tRNA dimethylallyltransferase
MHAEREKLYKRLDTRVEKMVEQGLIPEAQSLSEYLRDKESQGLNVDRTRGIWVSIGFKEMEPYFNMLRAGNSSDKQIEALKQTCIESVKTSTRQYSSKQTKWIRRKLWTALADVGANDRLYVLDATDPNDWDFCITEPTERIVQEFLSNGNLPNPESLSALAQTTLEERKTYKKEDQAGFTMKQISCEPCGKMLMGQAQWDIHIRGSAHRRTIKNIAKRVQRQEYLRSRASAEVAGEKSPTDETRELA